MKRNPLKKMLMLGAIVLGTLLVAPSQQDAEAHWRRRGYYRSYSTWRAPVYGGYYYAAPRYYYTAPVYSSYYYGGYPSYYGGYPAYYGGYSSYGYGGYPAYGYYGSYYSPGISYYRSGYRGGWGFSIGF